MAKKGGSSGSQTVTQQLDPMLRPFIQYALNQAIGQYQQRVGLPVAGGVAAVRNGIQSIPPVSPSAAAAIGANAATTSPAARRRFGREDRATSRAGESFTGSRPGNERFGGVFANGGVLALADGGSSNTMDYGTVIPAGPSGYQKYTGDLVAGFTPDTQDYFSGVRNATAGQEAMGQAQSAIQGAGAGYTDAPAYAAGTFSPGQITQEAIQSGMNPFQEEVINRQLGRMGLEAAENAAALRARQAARNALGGSRGAVESAIQARSAGQTMAETEAALRLAGYNQARTAAELQQQRQIEAAQNEEASRQFAENAARSRADFGLNQGLNFQNLSAAQQQQEAARLEGLKNIGAQQQALEQAMLDTEYKQYLEGRDWNKNELADFAAIAYGAPAGSTQTSTSEAASSGILGPIMYGVGSLFGPGGYFNK
jgi:hypothetical protein